MWHFPGSYGTMSRVLYRTLTTSFAVCSVVVVAQKVFVKRDQSLAVQDPSMPPPEGSGSEGFCDASGDCTPIRWYLEPQFEQMIGTLLNSQTDILDHCFVACLHFCVCSSLL